MRTERIYKNDEARQILATGIVPSETVTKCHEFRETSEKVFQSWVLKTAAGLGWWTHHTYDSRRSSAGYPDITLVRGGRLVFVELKTMTGRVSIAQQEWLDGLRACGVEVYVWRPKDVQEILEVLK